MKISVLLLFLTFNINSLGQDNDHYFDPKTSSMIPKYIGIVKKMKGKAIAEDRELSENSKVYPGEKIKTEINSFLVIELVDDTHLSIGPESEFMMDQWKYRTKNDREGVYQLMKGQMRALIRSKSADQDQLKVKTKLASMGVRGTEFLVNETIKDSKTLTQIGLLEGKINLKSELLNFKKNLIPGDNIILFQDGNVSKKVEKSFGKEELDFLNSEGELGSKNLLKKAVFEDFAQTDSKTPSVSVKSHEKNKTEEVMEVESLREKLNKLNLIREKNKTKKI